MPNARNRWFYANIRLFFELSANSMEVSNSLKQDPVFTFFIKLLCLTWPLYLLGFYVGEVRYPVSLSLLVYLVMSTVLLFRVLTSVRSKFSGLIGFIIFFQAVVFIFLGRGGSSITSAILLSAFILPFAYKARWSVYEKLQALEMLLWGFYLSFGFLILEIILSLRGQKLQVLLNIPFIRPAQQLEWERLRYFSTFDEPAHFAIYLVMLYVILDFADFSKLKKFASVNKVLIGFSVAVSLSLSGALLLVSYLVLARGLHMRGRNARVQFIKKIIFGGIFSAILLFSATLFFENVAGYFVSRLHRTIETFVTGEFDSEGIRTNTVRILTFLEGPGQIYGYENNEAAGVGEITGDPNFKIANTYVNIVIRLGYIGLFVFMLLMTKVIRPISRGFYLIFIMFNFVLGFWVSVLYWIPWVLVYFLFVKHENNKSVSNVKSQNCAPVFVP